MDKILIVGHHSSHYQELEKILQHCGMSQPLASHTQNLSARDITKKLLTATNKQISNQKSNQYLTNNNEEADYSGQSQSQSISSPLTISEPVRYFQRYPKKIWDNLAFDLILANIEQDFWGWSDSEAIGLLEYWAEFDEDIAFILTYDKPHQLLKNLIQSIDNIDVLTEQVIVEQLQDWIQYNQALLDFQEKYPQRCLLVNGEQVITSAEQYINTVSQKITWNVSSPSSELMSTITTKQIDEESVELEFFINSLLQQHKDSLQIYDYIQKKADISLIENDDFNNVSNIMLALKSSLKNRKELKYTQYDLEITKKQVEEKVEHIKIVQKELKETQYLQQITQTELKQFSDENKLLVNQLHSIQEEVENYHLKTEQDSKLLTELERRIQEKQEELGSNQEKIDILSTKVSESDTQISKLKQLQQKLEQEKLNHQQENEVIISQLHYVQKELENYALKNTEYQQQVSSLNKKIESSNSKTKEVQKIVETKQYELQKKQEEANNLEKAKKQAEEQAKKNEQKLTRLQAEMNKLHNTVNNDSHLKQENELLINQLHQVQEELEKYYLKTQPSNKTKSNHSLVAASLHYGAAERIKNDLPYRLGAKMVKSSKTPKDIVSLPFSLVQEYRNFQQEQGELQLPPLEQYQDIDEAEKIKQHLSYRLGKVVVESFQSSTKLAIAPISMVKEFRDFYKKSS